MAAAGLVLGIIALLGTTIAPFLFPYLQFAAPVCVGLGLPLSLLAYKRTRTLTTGAADVPRTGLTIHIVALVLIVCWTTFYFLVFFR